MSVPASRTLGPVLRDALKGSGDAVELVLGTGGSVLAAPEGNAYVNVVIGGQTVKVPRLSGAVVPEVGGPAYVLRTRNFILYLGTVKT
jgi:hypothetical protein